MFREHNLCRRSKGMRWQNMERKIVSRQCCRKRKLCRDGSMAHVNLIIVRIDMDMACGKQWQVVVCIYKQTNSLLAFLFVVDSCLLLVLLDHKKWDKNEKPRETNTETLLWQSIYHSSIHSNSWQHRWYVLISVLHDNRSGAAIPFLRFDTREATKWTKRKFKIIYRRISWRISCDVRSICSKNEECSASVVCFILNFMKKKIRNNINIQSVRWM